MSGSSGCGKEGGVEGLSCSLKGGTWMEMGST